MIRANLKLIAILLGLLSMATAYAASSGYAQDVYKQATQSLSKDDKETLNKILNSIDAGQASPLDALQGIYTKTWSKDIKDTLKIVKLSPTTAYFELAPMGAYIFGIADLQPDGSLLYREDNPREAEGEELDNHSIRLLYTAREHCWCKLGIHFSKDGITFTDPPDPQDMKENPQYYRGACSTLHGSARGGFAGSEFSRHTHRKLTAAQIGKMVQSEDFQKAVVWREMYLQGITPKPY